MTRSNVHTVEAALRSYREQDLATALTLYADDFRFTSPQDDHIGKAAYFEKCFPTVERLASQVLLHVLPVDDLVIVHYEYELKSGERFRNMEAITVRDGLIHDVQVFFGGAVQTQRRSRTDTAAEPL